MIENRASDTFIQLCHLFNPLFVKCEGFFTLSLSKFLLKREFAPHLKFVHHYMYCIHAKKDVFFTLYSRLL